jgi:hypothetical protein
MIGGPWGSLDDDPMAVDLIMSELIVYVAFATLFAVAFLGTWAVFR